MKSLEEIVRDNERAQARFEEQLARWRTGAKDVPKVGTPHPDLGTGDSLWPEKLGEAKAFYPLKEDVKPVSDIDILDNPVYDVGYNDGYADGYAAARIIGWRP